MLIKKLVLLSGLLLTACGQVAHKSTLSGSPEPEFGSTSVSELGTLVSGCDGLGYYLALSKMTPEQKQQELSALHSSLESQENGCEQLELALLLSLPESDLRKDNEADNLLADFLDNVNSDRAQDRALAKLLRGVIQERLRSQKMHNSLKRKLKQERRTSEDLEQRLQELTSQLEQLKSLERDINQQEQEISVPPKDKATDEK